MANRIVRFFNRLEVATHAGNLRLPKMTRFFLSVPDLPIEVVDNTLSISDDFLDRIITAYQKTPKPGDLGAIWNELSGQNSHYIADLEKADRNRLRHHFEHLFQGSLLSGMGHILPDKSSKRRRYFEHYFSLRQRDTILALAEALGVKALYSNHQTSLPRYKKETQADLQPPIAAIEAKLGHSIQVPRFGRPPAIRLGDAFFTPDSVRHAYVAWRLRQLGLNHDARILEIGGGFGTVARYARLNGFNDYSIIVLPHISAIQAAYLGASLGEEQVRLYGETGKAAITLLPNTDYSEIEHTLDLVLNMDSLPEMTQEDALVYMDFIKNQASFFLSFNQEATREDRKSGSRQLRVSELAESATGFTRRHRHPYWMEQGYVEEFFSVGT